MVHPGGNGTTLEPLELPDKMEGSQFLTKEGYPINSGTSFLMALEYTDRGPRAQAILTYGQSGDPKSPHFSDQTELFSKKQWRPILFTNEEIEADAELRVKQLSGPRPKPPGK
jgi:acyl-homoserine-lactone acylase